MRFGGTLKIKDLLMFELVYLFFLKLAVDTLHVPNAAFYLCDLINVVVLGFAMNKLVVRMRAAGASRYLGFFVLFALMTFVGFLLNAESVLLYLWGWRNIGRMFAFWLGCIVYFDTDDVERIFRLLFKIFVVNFVLTLFQFFALGIRGDFLGGVFGTSGASNSYTMNYLIIMTALCFARYMQRIMSAGTMVMYVGMGLVVSALAELKGFYLFFALIVGLILLYQRGLTVKGLAIVAGGLVGMIIAMNVLASYFPETRVLLTVDGFLDYVTDRTGVGYSGKGDLSRAGALSRIYDMFFREDFLRGIFGFGLGNCETSGFTFLNSTFYRYYEYLHYRWFFHAMTYLELGAVGLLMYLYYFVSIYFFGRRMTRTWELTAQERCYIYTSQVTALCCIMLAYYDSSLRVEPGYMLYFVLAIPFIIRKTGSRAVEPV